MKTEPYYLSSIDSSLLSNGWAKDDLIYQQNKTPQNNKTTYSVRPVCDAVVVVHDGAQVRKRVLETQNVAIQTQKECLRSHFLFFIIAFERAKLRFGFKFRIRSWNVSVLIKLGSLVETNASYLSTYSSASMASQQCQRKHEL